MNNYLLFVGASILLCLAPGPDMIFILGRTLAQGRKAGLLAALGINAGAYVHLLAAALGLSAVLAASAFAFTIIKWIGAAYLIFIGIQVLRSKQGSMLVDGNNLKKQNNFKIFWQGFLSDVLNPKVAIFYLAFLPQFVDLKQDHQLLQILFLGVTTNMIAILINVLLVIFAGLLSRRLRQNELISTWMNRAMGAVFILLGLKLAQEKI